MTYARRRPSSPLLALILSLGTASCGDDAVVDPSVGSSSGDASSTGPGSTSTDPTTGPAPTTTSATDGSGELTSSTGPDPTTGEPVTSTTTDDTTTGDTTTTTGDTTTTTDDTTTTGDTADASSSTGEPPCGPGAPGPDVDGDTVPDECDACPAGDDLQDGDGDGAADACDPCPLDDPDDSDMDGVCEGVDECPEGDDALDGDNDGIPDACDDEVLIVPPKPIDDYDVAGDGALVLVRAEAGSVFVTCYNGDRTVRRAEFVAGKHDIGNQIPPHPVINIARQSQKVLVTWFDRGGGEPNHRLAYTLLDDKCQPIVENKTAIAVPSAYMEFHDAAIDAVGNAVVAVSPDATFVNWIDPAGAAKGQQQAFDIDAVYGTHVAVNQSTGEGIVAAQVHSGNGIHYRRFKADTGWKDAGAVQMPVNYHYWYDGFTLGMNDKSEVALLWRSGGTALDMRFFDANGGVKANVQRATIDFEGWNGGHCYDSFRRRHQEIPLRGDNFVLGEVYNWITPQQNRITHHFEYTPAGQLVAEDSTTHNLDEGLTIRVDQLGFTYLRDSMGIHILKDYP